MRSTRRGRSDGPTLGVEPRTAPAPSWVDGPRALPPDDDPRLLPGRRRAHGDRPVRLVVIGDSFCFTDEHGPVTPGAATVWPTVAAATLEEALGVRVDVQVLAAPARTVRETLALTRKDRHVQFEVLAWADAVVVAVGSYDHAPIGVPAPIMGLVPHLRPARLRRRVRERLHALHPLLVRVSRGRVSRTAWTVFAEEYDALLHQVRGLAHGAAFVAVGPGTHRSAHYGYVHPRHAPRTRAQVALAAGHGVPTIEPQPLVEAAGAALNPDGIHWPAAAHERIGAAVAATLADQLGGHEPRPPRPGRDEG